MCADDIDALASAALGKLGLKPGELLLDRYELGELLGAGAMGLVFAARQVLLDQPVAVKLLVGASDDPRAEARFIREARTLAKVRSEHVARVLDAGTVKGLPCIVLELLDGLDLDTWLRTHGPLSVSNASTIAMQAADALGEAHRAGVVHRDIKPSNVMVVLSRGDVSAKVLDFGVAKLMLGFGAEERMATRSIAGTPDYMAPEQIDGLDDLDGRADVWSLGVVLYELVSGERPFNGATFSLLIRQISAEPHVPLGDRVPGVNPAFAAVIDRCLMKDRHARFSSMDELATALAPFELAGESKLLVPCLAAGAVATVRGKSFRSTGNSLDSGAFSQTVLIDAAASSHAQSTSPSAPLDASPSAEVASASLPVERRGTRVGLALALAVVFSSAAAALFMRSKGAEATTLDAPQGVSLAPSTPAASVGLSPDPAATIARVIDTDSPVAMAREDAGSGLLSPEKTLAPAPKPASAPVSHALPKVPSPGASGHAPTLLEDR